MIAGITACRRQGNANYAWVQHIVYHLAPNGVAGFVLANGSLSSNTSGEGEIRKRMVEADLVDCIVALPGQLFYSTQIPVCLWFLAKNKTKSGRGEANRYATAQARFCSSTPASWGACGPRPARPHGRGHRPHRRDLPRLAG